MFFFNGVDKKAIYIVLAILVAYSLFNMTQDQLLSMLLTLPAVIIAITFHEFAHAFTAYKLGDTTPKAQKRVTLNPLAHLDPYGFILLMFANIGWGKPVEINPNNFTSNKSRNACEALVAVAGPLMNFLLAIVFTAISCALIRFAPQIASNGIISIFMMELIWINLGLGVFNLLPIPPLDGSKIFATILPYNAKRWIENNYTTIYIVFIILWITGLLGRLTSPVVEILYKFITVGIGKLFGLL